jgi:hypothetical protein
MTSRSPELEAIIVAITPPQFALPVRRPRWESSVVSRLERLEAESRESRFWVRWGPLIYLVIGAAIPFGLGVDSMTRSLSLAQPDLTQPGLTRPPRPVHRWPRLGSRPGVLTQLPAAQSAAPPNASGLPASATAAIKPPPELVVLGYVEKPRVGREVVVSDGFEVYVTRQGETFADRFKVLKTTPTLVEVFDTYTNQALELSFSP